MKINVLEWIKGFLGKTENVEYEINESTTNTTLLYNAEEISKGTQIENAEREIVENTRNTISPYNAEKITKRASVIISPVPRQYKEMKNIKPKLRTSQWDSNYRIELFYLQAKYMENFEDDYEYTGEFIQYSPVYEDMTLSEQRGYFTWRTKVRKGVVEKTSLSFVFVYIYEILNLIGVSSTKDGFEKLLFIWNSYREYDNKINGYLKGWVKDFVIYYQMDVQKLRDIPNNEKDCAVALNDIYNSINFNNFENFAQLLNTFSSYKIVKSKFFAEYTEDYNEALKHVYIELKEFQEKNRKTSLFDRCFGTEVNSFWSPFSSAIFFDKSKASRQYVVNDFERYVCAKNEWKHFYYPEYNINRQFIGEILKTIESYLREIYEYPRKITFTSSSKVVTSCIEKTVRKYCVDNDKFGIVPKLKEQLKLSKKKLKGQTINAEPIIVEIDITKFDAIREKSIIIQEKLIVETFAEENSNKDTELFEENAFVVNDSQSGMQLFMNNLTDYEKKIISLLLQECSEKISLISKEVNIMEQVLLEGINEKALECIEDNIIDTNDDTPYIYEDYTEELKEVIKAWQQSQKELQHP